MSPYVLKSDLLIGKRVNDVQVLEGRYVAVTMDDWGLAIFSKEGELQYFVSSEMDVITSYSIHYTKLYDMGYPVFNLGWMGIIR